MTTVIAGDNYVGIRHAASLSFVELVRRSVGGAWIRGRIYRVIPHRSRIAYAVPDLRVSVSAPRRIIPRIWAGASLNEYIDLATAIYNSVVSSGVLIVIAGWAASRIVAAGALVLAVRVKRRQ